jgi:hypothetical protein
MRTIADPNSPDLGALTLLSHGGEADVYALDGKRVLRVLHRDGGDDPFFFDAMLYPRLEAQGVRHAHMLGHCVVDGRRAQILERVDGGTLLENLGRHPCRADIMLDSFAMVHASVLAVKPDGRMRSLGDSLDRIRGLPALIDRRVIDDVCSLFDSLPQGDALCHGDFHPGNVLMGHDGPCLIDWSGAFRGNPQADIAHTVLLMSSMPRLDTMGRGRYVVTSMVGRFAARSYLCRIHEMYPATPGEFSRWLTVMSLYRLYYGLPSERGMRRTQLTRAFREGRRH